MDDARARMLSLASQALNAAEGTRAPAHEAIFGLIWAAAHLAWVHGGPKLVGALTGALVHAVMIEIEAAAPEKSKLN